MKVAKEKHIEVFYNIYYHEKNIYIIDYCRGYDNNGVGNSFCTTRFLLQKMVA